MAKVEFAACKLITNVDLKISDIECINVGGLKSWADYNRFIVKEIYQYLQITVLHILLMRLLVLLYLPNRVK